MHVRQSHPTAKYQPPQQNPARSFYPRQILIYVRLQENTGPHNKIPCKALTGTFICFNDNPISIHIALDFIEGDKRGIFYENM